MSENNLAKVKSILSNIKNGEYKDVVFIDGDNITDIPYVLLNYTTTKNNFYCISFVGYHFHNQKYIKCAENMDHFSLIKSTINCSDSADINMTITMTLANELLKNNITFYIISKDKFILSLIEGLKFLNTTRKFEQINIVNYVDIFQYKENEGIKSKVLDDFSKHINSNEYDMNLVYKLIYDNYLSKDIYNIKRSDLGTLFIKYNVNINKQGFGKILTILRRDNSIIDIDDRNMKINIPVFLEIYNSKK
jgi:hypothetical protein